MITSTSCWAPGLLYKESKPISSHNFNDALSSIAYSCFSQPCLLDVMILRNSRDYLGRYIWCRQGSIHERLSMLGAIKSIWVQYWHTYSGDGIVALPLSTFRHRYIWSPGAAYSYLLSRNPWTSDPYATTPLLCYIVAQWADRVSCVVKLHVPVCRSHDEQFKVGCCSAYSSL